jgi:luciferase-like monooxygenase
MSRILERIQNELLSWPGISAEPHRFGGLEFRLQNRELGHIHGDRLVDIPFPMKTRNELVNSSRVSPHHVIPESGWTSYWITKGENDIPIVIELFRMRYDQLKGKNKPQKVEKVSNEL